MYSFLLSQVKQNLGRIGEADPKGGLGPFARLAFFISVDDAANYLSSVASKTLGVLTICASIWFIVQFVVGAFKWLASGGDKGNVESAKEHLTHAVIGLTIVVISYVLIALVGTILGLDILNPQKLIPLLGP